MFKLAVAVLLSFVVSSTASAEEDVTLPAVVTKQVMELDGRITVRATPVLLHVSSRLIKPLMVTGGQNPTLVTATYEYCSNKGVVMVGTSSERRTLLVIAAADLVPELQKFGYLSEAAFYARCAMQY